MLMEIYTLRIKRFVIVFLNFFTRMNLFSVYNTWQKIPNWNSLKLVLKLILCPKTSDTRLVLDFLWNAARNNTY
jgi:hypothetical protein